MPLSAFSHAKRLDHWRIHNIRVPKVCRSAAAVLAALNEKLSFSKLIRKTHRSNHTHVQGAEDDTEKSNETWQHFTHRLT
jgi:hypothetical protein